MNSTSNWHVFYTKAWICQALCARSSLAVGNKIVFSRFEILFENPGCWPRAIMIHDILFHVLKWFTCSGDPTFKNYLSLNFIHRLLFSCPAIQRRWLAWTCWWFSVSDILWLQWRLMLKFGVKEYLGLTLKLVFTFENALRANPAWVGLFIFLSLRDSVGQLL